MIPEEQLREAARMAEERFLARFPEPEDCQAVFSPAFERKIKALVRRVDHPLRYRMARAAAGFLLAGFIGGGGVLAFSVEARAAFAGWVREVYESYETWFAYRYTGAEPAAQEDTAYRPSWIPSGYTEQDILHLSGQTYIEYQDRSGSLITFGYSSNPGAENFYVEQAGTEQSCVPIDGVPAYLYADPAEEEPSVLLWTDCQRNTFFCIIAPLDSGSLIRMAESVEPEK